MDAHTFLGAAGRDEGGQDVTAVGNLFCLGVVRTWVGVFQCQLKPICFSAEGLGVASKRSRLVLAHPFFLSSTGIAHSVHLRDCCPITSSL